MREARVKARFVKGINKIFRQLSVEFQYLPLKPSDDATNPQFDDAWGAPLPQGSIDASDSDNLITVYEPLIDANSKNSTQLIQQDGANDTTYSKLWISKSKLPLKTLVKVDGTVLFIAKIGDYQHYAGVFLYYLVGKDDINNDSTVSSSNV